MSQRAKIVLWCCLLVGVLAGCATWSSETPESSAEESTAPAKMPRWLDERIAKTVKTGDIRVVRQTAKLIRQKHAAATAEAMLLSRLSGYAARSDTPVKEVRATAELYMFLPDAAPEQVFAMLIASSRRENRSIAWQVAAAHPSPEMADEVSQELSRRIAQAKRAGTALTPEIANAAGANDLTDSYPLLRAALMQEHNQAYAKAMIALNPDGASDDLLEYMAELDPRNLQKDHLDPIDEATCSVVLEDFQDHPPSLHHPNIKLLFFAAASKNQDLAEQAGQVLEDFSIDHSRDIAFLMAQTPTPVQVAFLMRLERDDYPSLPKIKETLATLGTGDPKR